LKIKKKTFTNAFLSENNVRYSVRWHLFQIIDSILMKSEIRGGIRAVNQWGKYHPQAPWWAAEISHANGTTFGNHSMSRRQRMSC